MATRSSSACVALINMRFMFVPCALARSWAGTRNAGAFRLETSCRGRACAATSLVFQRYYTTADPGSVLRMCVGSGPRGGLPRAETTRLAGQGYLLATVRHDRGRQ